MPLSIRPFDAYLLVDHDNIVNSGATIGHLLRSWLSDVAAALGPGVHSACVRAYGGWFEQERTTDLRFTAVSSYQAVCPSVVSMGSAYFRIVFEFADSLSIDDPASENALPRFTHTSVLRPAPQQVMLNPNRAPCGVSGCRVNEVRRWISKRKACSNGGCPNAFSEVFERREQKQVDVHLAVDTILLAQFGKPGSHVALASSDADVLPALTAAAVLARDNGIRLTSIRVGGQTHYLDDSLTRASVVLLQV